MGSASPIACWFLLLLGCSVGALPDTELLMRAPFAHDINWIAAADLCHPEASDLDNEITCDDHDNVISLEINLKLADAANATLPPGWANLTHLVNLTLHGAAGTVPLEWGSAGSFPKLQTLALSYSSISGSLPAGWGSSGCFPQLQTLRLIRNSLSGSLPAGWGSSDSFLKLQELDLSSNNLSGSLPVGWGSAGSFSQLQTLDLSNNNLSGSLQLEWGSSGSFPQLQSLFLSNVKLSGSLPAGWGTGGSFPQLQELDLSNNNLSGSLPGRWGSSGLPKLQGLWLYNNKLSGSLPTDWGSNGSFPQLQELRLLNNKLSGSLPAEWGSNCSFPQLQFLGLSDNSLSGSLPVGWGSSGSFPQLQRLVLSFNKLNGSLPAEWGTNSSFLYLQMLDLSNNLLSGSLPGGWGTKRSFSSMVSLSLSYNLNGSLPPSWGVPVNISIPPLQDGVGGINAVLPFSSITYLELWKNNFTGGVHLDWTNNPNFYHAHVVLDERLFRASKESRDFAKGICTEPYRYEQYRKWSIGISQDQYCAKAVVDADAFHFVPDSCFDSAINAGLDLCALERATRDALIAPWSCFGLILLLLCLERRIVDLLDRHFLRFPERRETAKKRIEAMLKGHHGILLGMLATVIAFWADIASDVPVLFESSKKTGAYFYILLALMFGSHILDAILIATYAIAKGEKQAAPSQGPGTLFSRLPQKFERFIMFFSRLPQKAAWFMVYFLLAILALPALDVVCVVKSPSHNYDMPVDAIFKVDLEGYQAMRLVIGAVFRTIPTAIVVTVIVALGNKPENGTFFTPEVVGVSLSLSALQIIIVIIRIRQRAAAKGMSKLQLLWSVFTLSGLALLSDGDVSATAWEGPRRRKLKGLPFCTEAPLGPPPSKPQRAPLVKVGLHVQGVKVTLDVQKEL